LRKSCNGCYFEHKKLCYWFKYVQGSNPKSIPIDTFNNGCKHYKNNVLVGYKTGNELTDKIIQVFDGEIIGEKYKPIVNRNHYYKKKKYTTRHNYTERKDF
jgi:hypothetical protein